MAPAAAACTRSLGRPRGPARQALRPGCEELAALVRRPNRRWIQEARPRAGNRHGGAPKRRASPRTGREAPRKRLGVPQHARVPRKHPRHLGAPPPRRGKGKRRSRRPRANGQRAAKLWLFDIVRRVRAGDRAMMPRAMLARRAPSSLAGEGQTVSTRFGMGEGLASQKLLTKRTPHPSSHVATPSCPLPQGERALTATARRLSGRRSAACELARQRAAIAPAAAPPSSAARCRRRGGSR